MQPAGIVVPLIRLVLVLQLAISPCIRNQMFYLVGLDSTPSGWPCGSIWQRWQVVPCTGKRGFASRRQMEPPDWFEWWCSWLAIAQIGEWPKIFPFCLVKFLTLSGLETKSEVKGPQEYQPCVSDRRGKDWSSSYSLCLIRNSVSSTSFTCLKS